MCGYFLNHFGPDGRSQAFERNQLVSHTPVIASVHSVELGPSEIPEQGAEESTPPARIPSKRGWNCGIKKDKRNKRQVGSIRPAFDRFPGRITASYTRFMSTSQRELPRSADFFRGGRNNDRTCERDRPKPPRLRPLLLSH